MSVVEPPTVTPFPAPEPAPRGRPKVKKLRLILILSGLTALAVVSTVFGMMMAVASDLPALESLPQYRHAENSTLWDARGRRLGLLVSNQNRVLVSYDDISPAMRHAIIAIEDRRFYTNSGVDLRGIGRAFAQDLVRKHAAQGGSTITQQFVKVALQAQSHRTVFQKLREAALAYHLTRKWSKEKILTEYLNAIYFGNGAYGVESAARTYFQADHPGCGTQHQPACASLLRPAEAAMIAGIVQNPSAYDPLYHPQAARIRRNVVLRNMLDQGYLTHADYEASIAEAAPEVTPPYDDSRAPYFTTWVRQQLVDRFGPHRAFEGGLKVKTTLDLDFQGAAQRAVNTYMGNPNGPSAALVAIDNKTGEVRAMVGGRAMDGRQFAKTPFNLATQGQRQPGSSFKPFVLAAALRKGITPGSLWTSKKKIFTVPGTNGREKFVVNNYEGNYTGVTSLANATINSDNSVYAEVGFRTGFRSIARMAQRMGIRTPVSTNPAITLGGLKQGVTVLDMAHAYETLAHDGQRVEGTLGSGGGGPVGIRRVEAPSGHDDHGRTTFKTLKRNATKLRRVVSSKLAETEVPILRGVVRFGTGKRAAIPNVVIAGKTGTTENYGDAWFVGFTDRWTVAVWVGYPDRLKPMKTEFQGESVSGGTYPAMIWHDFVVAALKITQERDTARRAKLGLPPAETPQIPGTSIVPPTTGTTTAPPATTTTTTPQAQATTPTTPAPTTPTPATPAPGQQPPPPDATQPPAPGTGGGTGAGSGGAGTP